MPYDEETVAVYDQQADKYLEMVNSAETDAALTQFLAHVPEGGSILDLGCGPGNYAATMQSRGFNVTATDASLAMVEIARQHETIEVHQATFEDLDDVNLYDGIWANFSLLHATREDFPRYLNKVATALKPKGHLHLGMKTGTAESRDKIGRHYAYYSVQELNDHLPKAAFSVLRVDEGEARGLAGDVEPWATLIAVRT